MRNLSKLALGLTLALSSIGAVSAQAPAFTKKHLYDEKTDPKVLIAEGLKQAKREHKRVILDFGGDWCGDCQVLDLYFHEQPNADLLAKNFVVVHVFIGNSDKNLDLAQSYGVPIEKGVPALSVIDENGKIIHAQKTGGFSDIRHMDSDAVHTFLERWKS